MPDPVLHVIAGPDGSGKRTFFETVLAPTLHLPFVNADLIAAEHWPTDPSRHAYKAAELAAAERDRRMKGRESFVTATIFSHDSSLELLESASIAGYLVTLHVLLISEDLAVTRVMERKDHGGPPVPVDGIRSRYQRLWALVGVAVRLVGEAIFYDNSRLKEPFRLVAQYRNAHLVRAPTWPPWTPHELLEASPES